MQTAAAAAAAERLPDRYVARLAGEVDEDELMDEIGLAGVTWLRETGLATCPSPPPPTSRLRARRRRFADFDCRV